MGTSNSLDTLWGKAAWAARLGYAVTRLDDFFDIFKTTEPLRVIIIDELEKGQTGFFLQVIEWTHNGHPLRYHAWTIKRLVEELKEREIPFPHCS